MWFHFGTITNVAFLVAKQIEKRILVCVKFYYILFMRPFGFDLQQFCHDEDRDRKEDVTVCFLRIVTSEVPH